MSDAIAFVHFPDGEVRFAIYQGSSDLLHARLSATPEEAWNHRGHAEYDHEADPVADEVFDVVVWNTYGPGYGWPARATRGHVVDGFDPWDDDAVYSARFKDRPMTICTSSG